MKYTSQMFFTLIILSNSIIAMDITKSKKELSLATKVAVEAIENNSFNSLKLALLSGADIMHTTERGDTLLLLASHLPIKKEIAFYLLERPEFQNSATINQQNADGNSVLMLACQQHKIKFIKELLKINNINLDLQDKTGCTALHHIADQYANKKTTDIIILLLERGATPTIQNDYGATPVFCDAILNNSHIPSILLKKVILQRDNHGNTQLHLLAMGTAHDLIQNYNRPTKELFTVLFKHLSKNNEDDMWCKNNNNKLPIELAYETYSELYKYYKRKKTSYFRKAFNEQEKALHTFLEFYSSRMKTKPIIISSPCALELNIETAMAEKYQDDEKYYESSLEWKDKLKQQLRDNPSQVPLLWQSEKATHIPMPYQIGNSNIITHNHPISTTNTNTPPSMSTIKGRVPVISLY